MNTSDEEEWGKFSDEMGTYKVERSPNGGLQVFKQIVGLLIK